MLKKSKFTMGMLLFTLVMVVLTVWYSAKRCIRLMRLKTVEFLNSNQVVE
jgi:uncharacterized membrane protein